MIQNNGEKMIPPEQAAKELAEWLNNLTIDVVTKKEPCPHCRGVGEVKTVIITVNSPK